ncbi:MAG: hypothetical protein GQE15_00370 [Archangiaceae bacterium]|nr:hypothetical protein [Archangiaceae bacterium]
MPRLLLVTLVLCVSERALAEPPPPEIQAILVKARTRQLLTTDEQRQLREWQQRGTAKASGLSEATGPGAFGGMPADVAAIMERAQRGQPPSPAELERLKTWSAKVEGQKGELLSGEKADAELLRASKPVDGQPASAKKSPFVEGTLRVTQTVDTVAKKATACEGGGEQVELTHQVTETTTPVVLRTQQPGRQRSFTAEVPASGPFSVILEPRGVVTPGATTATVTHCGAKTATAPGAVVMGGELVLGGSRVFVNLTGLMMLDSLRSDVTWQASAAVNDELARRYGAQVAQVRQVDARLNAAVKGANFTMNADALRALLKKRTVENPFVSGTYSHRLETDENTVTVSTVVTLDFRTPTHDSLEMTFLGDDGKPDQARWRSWLPWPWLESDDDVGFFAEVASADAHAPKKRHDLKTAARVAFQLPEGRRCTVQAQLIGVGRQSGIVTNWPPNPKDDRLSLFFPLDAEQHLNEGWELGGDGQFARTKEPVTSAELTVVARSSGAYGQVTANCVEDLTVQATFPFTGKTTLPLPRDENDNHVADQFEEEHGGHRASGQWDEEPANGMAHAGDGISLFEEYRGFLVSKNPLDGESKPTFRRLSPEEKEVFVSIRVKSKVAVNGVGRGLQAFKNTLHVEPLNIPARFLAALDKPKPQDTYARWCNANTPKELLAKHDEGSGLTELTATPFIENGPYVDENGQAVATHAHTEGYSPDETLQSRGPRETFWISVYPSRSEGLIAAAVENWKANATNSYGRKYLAPYLAATHLTQEAFVKKVAQTLNGSTGRHVVEDFLAFSVTHEFGHAFGVPHHGKGAYTENGDVRCPMRYFTDDRWWLAIMMDAWHLDDALVPPSFSSTYLYDYDAINGCGNEYCPAKGAEALSDFATPTFQTLQWKFDQTCLSKLRLWIADSDKYLPTPKK